MAKKLTEGIIAPDFEFMTPWEGPLSFYPLLDEGAVALYFLRYLGCPVCRMEMDAIKADAARFEGKGVRVVVMLQSARQTLAENLRENDYPFLIACDPEADIYTQYRVSPGSFLQYVAPPAALKAMKALREGYTHGRKEGLELQLPAVFLVGRDRQIRYLHYGRHVADVVETGEVLKQAG
ncbi:MAG: AhpC/TSA family protein [Proteobacteria bacterium]|nr:AhpC/TSA family protein [Pseudomonadota bacterium]